MYKYYTEKNPGKTHFCNRDVLIELDVLWSVNELDHLSIWKEYFKICNVLNNKNFEIRKMDKNSQ